MPIRLDGRLTAVAAQSAGRTVCDIGSDHGKLACRLVQTGAAERAIATDISAPSLAKAKRLAEELGIADLVDTRIGDGLEPIAAGEADTVVIAGMGGDLIADILRRGAEQGKTFGRLVLSPNTRAERVRDLLAKTGYTITYDAAVECAGKRYAVITAVLGEGEKLDGMQKAFGKFFRTDAEFAAAARAELESLTETLRRNPDAANLAKRAELLSSALAEMRTDKEI